MLPMEVEIRAPAPGFPCTRRSGGGLSLTRQGGMSPLQSPVEQELLPATARYCKFLEMAYNKMSLKHKPIPRENNV